MSGNVITINTIFTGAADGPTFSLYRDSIGRDPRLVTWHTPKESLVSLVNGRVSRAAGRSVSGVAAAQTLTARQPVFVQSVAALSGKPAMTFANARNDALQCGNVYPSGASQDHTKVVLLKNNAAPAGNQVVCGGVGDIAHGHELMIGPSRIYNRIGRQDGAQRVEVFQTYVPGSWMLAILPWDAAASTAKISINGNSFASTTVVGASCTDTQFAIGATQNYVDGFEGQIADVLTFNVDLSKSAHSDMLNLVKSYFRDRYSLSIG